MSQFTTTELLNLKEKKENLLKESLALEKLIREVCHHPEEMQERKGFFGYTGEESKRTCKICGYVKYFYNNEEEDDD